MCVSFPVLHASNQSIKNKVIGAVTGGKLSKDHDGVTFVEGLKDVSLKIRKGERIGIVGHNGSGKSTLLRVFSGIYTPISGNAQIDGNVTSLINIGLGIDPEATGIENIKLRAAMMGISAKELKGYMNEIIDFSGLGEFIHMPFRTYSSGMQMRLAFSVSTTIKPQILIMDEWLSLGDSEFETRAKSRMNELLNLTEILILASHSKSLLLENCDRLIWLEHGQIKMDGPVDIVADAYFS